MKLDVKFHAKTIRKQILHPFLIILTVLPIAIIVFFNIGFHYIMQHSAREELSNTIKTMESLLTSNPDMDSSEAADLTRELGAALTAAQLAGNTKFYVFLDRQIKYPLDLNGDKIASYFGTEVAAGRVKLDDNVRKCRVDGRNCIYKALPLEHYDDYTNLAILFVTEIGDYTTWIVSLNLILIVVSLFAVMIGGILAMKTADSISSPIIDACAYAAQIGNGNFITVPVVKSNAEIKQFCKSLNAMSTRLKDYDETQKQFLQNASHELRTPLMSIQGYAEGIESDVFSDPKEAASVIKKESLRLNKLVTELLTLSRIENHTYVHELQVYNISDLMLDYIQRVNGLLLHRNLKLVTKFSEKTYACIDEGLFSQTIINIISNAIRYASTTITISTYLEKTDGAAMAVAEIADDGEGIEEEELPHLFERFYKGKKGNFGLGLAISKSAMESMGGSLSALNREGAVFLLKAPYAEKN